ncbi:hypothetical protein HJC23_003907 [Cyclotella cryptica]|uniref:Uncharacterized protein n=1 Tax=Cyclotella cryptica TaxID=29204 RepID=A0ABD3PED4_9STRA|eukprot:CCRYP_015583-RA/>CCRYP_015583-RA protein AED:0.01 eAED:-0.00 QI:0/-1/0/1/-1/1/1/0/268
MALQEEESTPIDWNLTHCCNDEALIFLSLTLGYLLANFFLWNTALLRPMKLIAVFVHELHHAMACHWTGGSAASIWTIIDGGTRTRTDNNNLEEEDQNYTGGGGGVSKYIGGRRWFIIPAGYVGCSFWGMVFVVLSGDRLASLIIAVGFLMALIVSVMCAPSRIVVWVSVGFIVLTTGFIFLDRFVFHPLLQYLTLYYGVFIGSFSIYDIYDDLVTRSSEGSDAYACSRELVPCCLPRFIGLQFVVMALGFLALGLYLALVWMTTISI